MANLQLKVSDNELLQERAEGSSTGMRGAYTLMFGVDEQLGDVFFVLQKNKGASKKLFRDVALMAAVHHKIGISHTTLDSLDYSAPRKIIMWAGHADGGTRQSRVALLNLLGVSKTVTTLMESALDGDHIANEYLRDLNGASADVHIISPSDDEGEDFGRFDSLEGSLKLWSYSVLSLNEKGGDRSRPNWHPGRNRDSLMVQLNRSVNTI